MQGALLSVTYKVVTTTQHTCISKTYFNQLGLARHISMIYNNDRYRIYIRFFALKKSDLYPSFR